MSRSLVKEPYVAPVLGKQTRGFSLLTHVLSVSVLARSLSWIAASFSSLSWSLSLWLEFRAICSFSQSSCSSCTLVCAACKAFSVRSFSLEARQDSPRHLDMKQPWRSNTDLSHT